MIGLQVEEEKKQSTSTQISGVVPRERFGTRPLEWFEDEEDDTPDYLRELHNFGVDSDSELGDLEHFESQ